MKEKLIALFGEKDFGENSVSHLLSSRIEEAATLKNEMKKYKVLKNGSFVMNESSWSLALQSFRQAKLKKNDEINTKKLS